MQHRQTFVVGELRGESARPIFRALPAAFLGSVEEAVSAALAHWGERSGDPAPAHRVYRSEDHRTAIIEVLDPRAEMTSLGLYKVVGMFYADATAPQAAGPLGDILHELQEGNDALRRMEQHAAKTHYGLGH